MTNADAIRKMDNEQLAIFIDRPTCDKCTWQGQCQGNDTMRCEDGVRKWLETEVKQE